MKFFKDVMIGAATTLVAITLCAFAGVAVANGLEWWNNYLQCFIKGCPQ